MTTCPAVLYSVALLSSAAVVHAVDQAGRVVGVGDGRNGADAGAPIAPRVGGTGCIDVPETPWFTVVRGLPDCARDMIRDINLHEDINGDGVRESLGIDYSSLQSGGTCAVARFETVGVVGNLSIERRCVLGRAPLDAFLQAAEGSPLAGIEDAGLRDLDEDGDLDLVLSIYTAGFNLRVVWVENTGYEASSRLVGDINGDGIVNASDLALLLDNWST